MFFVILNVYFVISIGEKEAAETTTVFCAVSAALTRRGLARSSCTQRQTQAMASIMFPEHSAVFDRHILCASVDIDGLVRVQ